jgi:hypothetical protein
MAQPAYPLDLVRDQRAWNRAYEALATARPGTSTTVLRRRLLRLSCRIAFHPWWTESRSATTWAQLRHDVLAYEQRDRTRVG